MSGPLDLDAANLALAAALELIDIMAKASVPTAPAEAIAADLRARIAHEEAARVPLALGGTVAVVADYKRHDGGYARRETLVRVGTTWITTDRDRYRRATGGEEYGNNRIAPDDLARIDRSFPARGAR